MKTKKQVRKAVNQLIDYYENQANRPLSKRNTEYHWRDHNQRLLILKEFKKYL